MPDLADYQGEFHDKLRDFMVDQLRAAGNTIETEVKLILPGDPPIAARLDILGRNKAGELLGVEIKTGDDPTFTPEQMVVYPHAAGGAGVWSPDRKITNPGLVPGRPLPAIEITTVYARAEGERLRYWVIPAVPLHEKNVHS